MDYRLCVGVRVLITKSEIFFFFFFFLIRRYIDIKRETP